GPGPITQALAKDSAKKAARDAILRQWAESAPRRWIERLTQLKNQGRWDYIEKLRSGALGKNVATQVAEAERTMGMRQTAARALALAEAEAAAAEGTLVAGVGTTLAAVALPVVGMVAVQVALGAPYYEAREAAKTEQTEIGFGRGFVMGLLEWKWEW